MDVLSNRKRRHKMNREELHKFIAESKGNESNICQICAIKNGEIVYEDQWHRFMTDDAVHVMSVTKGIMALLTGIAIDKGAIRSVDQHVLDFFPDYEVKRGEKTIYDVTIRHLLTMTAPYKYRSEPWKKVCTSEDWTKTTLDFLGGRKGITGEFKYATIGIQILAGVIENATGENCLEFANKNLFVPLGLAPRISHGDSDKDDQMNYVMNKEPGKKEWYTDPTGTVTAGWGICLSARDMAVIGDMVLQGGKGIVSSKYISEMLTPHLKLGKKFGFMEYGYLWYKPYEDREVYAALGDSGNAIYVNKEKGITVGVTGTFKPLIFDRVEFIEKRILPQVML